MHGDTVEWFFPTSLFSVWRLSLRRKDRYVSLSVSVKKGENGQNARNFSLPVTFCGEVILASLVYSCFKYNSWKAVFQECYGKRLSIPPGRYLWQNPWDTERSQSGKACNSWLLNSEKGKAKWRWFITAVCVWQYIARHIFRVMYTSFEFFLK